MMMNNHSLNSNNPNHTDSQLIIEAIAQEGNVSCKKLKKRECNNDIINTQDSSNSVPAGEDVEGAS